MLTLLFGQPREKDQVDANALMVAAIYKVSIRVEGLHARAFCNLHISDFPAQTNYIDMVMHSQTS
jgi:hypothetical protein